MVSTRHTVKQPPPGVSYVAVAGAALLRSDGEVEIPYEEMKVPALPHGQRYVAADSSDERFLLLLRSDNTVLAVGDNTFGQCDVPEPPAGVVYGDPGLALERGPV